MWKKKKRKRKKIPHQGCLSLLYCFVRKKCFFLWRKSVLWIRGRRWERKEIQKKQTINGILFSENQNKIRNHIRRTKRCVRAMFNYLTIFSLSPSPSIITICAAGIVEFERKRDRKRKRRNFLIFLPKKKTLSRRQCMQVTAFL